MGWTKAGWLAAALLACACGTNEVEIRDNVTVFDDGLASAMVVEEGRILVPAPGNEWVERLAPGRILVAAWRAGFLRRLDAVQRQGDLIVLRTTQAGLPDAVRRGGLKEQIDLS